MARPSPSCAHDDDRLRLPAASPSRSNSAEKKESTDLRLSQLCPPYVTPSSSSSLEYHRSDARIVENGFAAGSGMSNSAKVGLVLKRAALSRSSGRWNDDDFDVLVGGEVVGRIYKAHAAPVGTQWL